VNIHITLVYSPAPREVFETIFSLVQGASLEDAVRASGALTRFPDIQLAEAALGVWGRKAQLGQVLEDGDRVEIYRPLTADPMEARRTRFKRQGARTTGLFAQKRAGAKSGY
jgi:putative ubiquitin-RnfH superfamily antitoxin RatB of RatAB toxin-antitoxin module